MLKYEITRRTSEGLALQFTRCVTDSDAQLASLEVVPSPVGRGWPVP